MKTQETTTTSYAANRTVEITVWLIGILVFAFLLASTNSNASNFQNADEAYIDDIPFDTEMVVHLLMMPEYDFEEEAYVDDIPFNTEFISAQWLYKEAFDAINVPFGDLGNVTDYTLNKTWNSIDLTNITKSMFDNTIILKFVSDHLKYLVSILVPVFLIIRAGSLMPK